MNLGFFFGAGAEIGYGLPSGSKFAIDLLYACAEAVGAAADVPG